MSELEQLHHRISDLEKSETKHKQTEEKLKATNQQLIASEQQLRAANQQLAASEQQLKTANQQLIASEQEIKKHAHNLGERVKELDSLYGIAESIRTRKTIEEILQDTANIIPPGWHYPEITRGKLRFDGKEYLSKDFKESKWKQSADIIVNGKVRGSIEVYYLEKCPELDEGPFMKEERKLIDGMAKTISEAIKRKLMEEALKKSEQQYRNFFEKDISGDYLSMPNGKLLDCNPAFIKMLGYGSLEEIQEVNTEKLYPHPINRQQFINQLTSNKILIDSEFDLIRRDGKKINCVENVTGIFNDKGELVRIQGYILDITKRKRAEEKLRQSEEKYQDLYDNAPDMFVSVDAKTSKIRDCNQTLANALGYSKEEILGRPIFDMYHPDSMEGAKKAFKSFIETGEVHDFELQLKRKDGNKIDVSLNVSAVHDEEGNIIYSRSVWRDITRRKQVEEELETEKNKLQSIIEAIASGLTIRDLDYNLIYQSELTLDLYGNRLGEKCYKVFENLDEICEGCPVELTYKDGKSHFLVKDVKLPSGEVIWFENISNPIRNATGEIVACLEINTDITERKQAEEELKKRNIELETFNEVTVGRELKLIELKKEINEMLEKSGEKPKYEIPV